MLKFVLLVALVALAAADKRIVVKHADHVQVTDMDRMSYDGLYALEQSHPEQLQERVHPEDVAALFESAIGADWKNYVEIDESEPISYLELIRLSTSINFVNKERAAVEKQTRGYDGDEGVEAYPNMCMCHGTFHSTFHNAVNGMTGDLAAAPFRGVRVLTKGGTYYGNNPYPKNLPQDCLLCEGLTNCQACCHGPCTIGTPADYDAAVAAMGDSNGWPLGLYPCPEDWTFTSDAESDAINNIDACRVTVENCGDAVALCSCSQKRRLMQTLGCNCMDVMVLCDDCFQAWDAIDKYKHCDCVDYARYYQMDRP
jgi:hypothetical protein